MHNVNDKMFLEICKPTENHIIFSFSTCRTMKCNAMKIYCFLFSILFPFVYNCHVRAPCSLGRLTQSQHCVNVYQNERGALTTLIVGNWQWNCHSRMAKKMQVKSTIWICHSFIVPHIKREEDVEAKTDKIYAWEKKIQKKKAKSKKKNEQNFEKTISKITVKSYNRHTSGL